MPEFEVEFFSHRYICFLCWELPRACVFLNCCHIVTCSRCCYQTSVCPICYHHMYTKYAEEHKVQARKLAKAQALELKRDLERERLTTLGRERGECERAQLELEQTVRDKERRVLEGRRKAIEEKRKLLETQAGAIDLPFHDGKEAGEMATPTLTPLTEEEHWNRMGAKPKRRSAAVKPVQGDRRRGHRLHKKGEGKPLMTWRSQNSDNSSDDETAQRKSVLSWAQATRLQNIPPYGGSKPWTCKGPEGQTGQNSDDSTDDEFGLKGSVPPWAQGQKLQQMEKQYTTPTELNSFLGQLEAPRHP